MRKAQEKKQSLYLKSESPLISATRLNDRSGLISDLITAKQVQIDA